MTKPSAVLIAAQVDMKHIPEADRDAARRFVTQYLRGMTPDMNKRFYRAARRIMNADPGEGFMCYTAEPRSLVFHKRWFAVEGRIFDAQDAFVNRERFRDYIKTGAGFGDYMLGKDRFGADKLVFVPKSTNFESTSDDEMREFVESATAFLHTERPLRKFWPHLKPAQRMEMMDAMFSDPKEMP